MFDFIFGVFMLGVALAFALACWILPIWIGFEVLRAVGCL